MIEYDELRNFLNFEESTGEADEEDEKLNEPPRKKTRSNDEQNEEYSDGLSFVDHILNDNSHIDSIELNSSHKLQTLIVMLVNLICNKCIINRSLLNLYIEYIIYGLQKLIVKMKIIYLVENQINTLKNFIALYFNKLFQMLDTIRSKINVTKAFNSF